MAASTYGEALARLVAYEGGYSNHPSDPGGPTNFGITLAVYRRYVKPNATAADVRAMSVDEAKAIYRQAIGDLNFANMPLSADFSRLLSGPARRSMYADFRPDVDWPGQYGVSYRTIATNIIAQVRERAPAVPVLSTITHNHYAYRDARDSAYQRLRTMLDEMMAACHAAGVKAIGSTVKHVTDEVLASPAESEPFVCEGAIFDLAAERAQIQTAP